jgi:hypothetical protein
MFTKKDDCIDSRGFTKTRTNMFNISKFNTNRIAETAASKTRIITQKIIVVPDFNLNTLTKELEFRRKKL